MVAILTDSHFFNGFSFGTLGPDGINSRLRDIERTHLEIVETCKSFGVTEIYHGGDLYHRRNPTQLEISISLSWIDAAVEAGMQVWMVPGNHDHNLIQHAFAYFERENLISDKVHLVTKSGLLPSKVTDVYAIPFGPEALEDPTKVAHEISQLSKHAVVFGHAQTEDFAPGIEQDFNERMPMTLPSNILHEAEARICLGHIHNRQQFFLGSCVRLAFNDSHDKYIWVGDDKKHIYIDTKQPDFVTVTANMELGQEPESEIEKLNIEDKTFVRLVVENADPSYSLDIEGIKKLLPANASLVQKSIQRKTVSQVENQTIQVKSLSLKEALEEYQQRHDYVDSEQAELERRLLQGIHDDS